MNPDLASLKPYPFERLATLLAGLEPPADQPLIKLSVGEPQHAPPKAVIEALQSNLHLLAKYPATKGDLALRESQAGWMQRRYGLSGMDGESTVLPVNGTREALFAIAQTVVGHGQQQLVGSPNPFYQIYEGAALLAGAQTALMDTRAEDGFLPHPDQFDDDTWDRLALLYLCSPGNPSGAVMDTMLLSAFIEKAQKHDVVLVSDECYSEIYPDEDAPPTGLLAACEAMGLNDYRNCISMHSLSKRSNLPGLRSGFAAGDAGLLREFLRYRSYHGSAMPPHHQVASAVAWDDEEHVRQNRAYYREKFEAVTPVLDPVLKLNAPEGGFYLWPELPIDDETFVRRLYSEAGVLVLPGSYIARDGVNGNPGANRARMALVPTLEDCVEAAHRIRRFVESQ